MATPSVSASNSSVSASSSQFTYSNGSSYFPLPFHLQQPAAVSQYAVPAAAPTVPVVGSVYPASAAVSSVHSLPQYQQAQQLFQRDARTITPEALESVKAALASSEIEHKAEAKKNALPRKAAGQSWEDPTLAEWPENDYRFFCGDLGNEVVRDKRTGKTKGYGFISFSSPSDLAAALKEMNGKYVGNRPIKLRKSKWQDRTDFIALEKQKNHSHKKPKLSKKSVLHK